MLVIVGYGSKIAQELLTLLPKDEQVVKPETASNISLHAHRYLFCAGVLHGKSFLDLTASQIAETMAVNLLDVMKHCEIILHDNPVARICVMGSESGFVGSYDEVYSVAKAGLHSYVANRRLGPLQQLVSVAPGIISDAGMTLRRQDIDVLESKLKAHPKQRFIRSIEVAKLIHFLLYQDEGYITNTTIRMNGGGHLK